jgi:hypothetical protein
MDAHVTAHIHSFDHWPFPCPVSTAAFTTAKVAREHFPILQVAHDSNGDWQFLDATTDEPGECVMLCLGCVFERDASLAHISDLPHGWGAFREAPGGPWERWQNPPDDDSDNDDHDHASCDSTAADTKALSDIETYGLHILSISEEGGAPSFSYSIGIERSLGLPELIVIGLTGALGGSVINECYRRMKAGERIEPGAVIDGLLDGGFPCLIGEVDPAHYREYMGWAIWLYKEAGFRALQIIWPSATTGVFPWEPEASDWLKRWQPLLGARTDAAGPGIEAQTNP